MDEERQRFEKHFPTAIPGEPIFPKTSLDKLDEYLSRIEALEAENARLREALDWYGEQAAILAKATLDSEFAKQRLKRDMGGRARAALKQEGGE